MGKDKTKAGVPNKHMHARISFLQQAATYLTQQSGPNFHSEKNASHEAEANLPRGTVLNTTNYPDTMTIQGDDVSSGLQTDRALAEEDSKHKRPDQSPPASSARLLSHLTLIAQKSQIRLDTSIKHQICKRCSSLLVEGSTCRKFIENQSRGGRKPHADVLVVECGVCGARKHWPVGMERQARKAMRAARMKADEKNEGECAVNESHTDEKMEDVEARL